MASVPWESYEAGTSEEALEFFTKRYEELEGKVHLLEQRVASGRLAPEEATVVGEGAARAGRRRPRGR